MFFHWGPRPTFAHFEKFEILSRRGSKHYHRPSLDPRMPTKGIIACREAWGVCRKYPLPLLKILTSKKKWLRILLSYNLWDWWDCRQKTHQNPENNMLIKQGFV